MAERVRAEPRAAALVESMRDLGYSLETALADIVDNSIAARARNVDITFEAIDSEPWIAITDDGIGMSRDELYEAMRPGTRSPLEERAKEDLGRFGLGLKTASFSQCRRLTVVSRKDGTKTAARWDLDFVAEENEWLLQMLDDTETEAVRGVESLGTNGTLVLWERLDRLADVTSGSALKDHLYERLDAARDHLGLVFHRYLLGDHPFRKVSLHINGLAAEPFDPFNSKNPATQHLPTDVIKVDGRKVVIRPYILPHHKKVGTVEYERYAGEGGYLRNQGFYIYRNGRLILHGTWFRLARQAELTKLARVQVDMPTELDSLWKIDVRKASAQPPFIVRQRLRKIIDQITGTSGRVYTSRGRKLTDGVTSLWVRRVDKNEIFYDINREHPLLEHFLNGLSEEQQSEFNSVLKVIERYFPTDAFFADSAGSPEKVHHPVLADETLEQLLDVALDLFKSQQMNCAEITEVLARTEPYRSQWKAVERLLGEKGLAVNGV